jgi:hypothetical protein
MLLPQAGSLSIGAVLRIELISYNNYITIPII